MASTVRRLPQLPSVAEIIRLYGLSAKSELSQNFLLDLNITRRIARCLNPHLRDSTVIEVGPGPGSLTTALLQEGAGRVIAVETDRRFRPPLSLLMDAALPRLSVVWGDILQVDEAQLLDTEAAAMLEHLDGKLVADASAFGMPGRAVSVSRSTGARTHSSLAEALDHGVAAAASSSLSPHALHHHHHHNNNVKLVGNLPFNVATEILLKWMRQLRRSEGVFRHGPAPMVLTFQTEVADRIVAQPGSKEYGRLSVMVQHCCSAVRCFRIPGSAFVPVPKVESSLVRIDPLPQPRSDVSVDVLEFVCRELFNQRRKVMRNAAQILFGEHTQYALERAHIDPGARAEDVTVEQWCTLAKIYAPAFAAAQHRPASGTLR